ncbi:hypothetical protein MRX96_043173 [Rhipicephalus microplus]
MVHMLSRFPSFDLRATDNNTGHEQTRWIEIFENFLLTCDITANARKKALLLHCAVEEVYDENRRADNTPLSSF